MPLTLHFLSSPSPASTCFPHYWRYEGHQAWLSSVQSLSHVRLFATPWIAARQASLSVANSRSSLKLMSIESVMPSSHLILCRPLLLLPSIPPRSGSFPMSQLFTWGGQSTGVSALASVLPKNTQDWSPLEWTGWISLQPQVTSYHFIFSVPKSPLHIKQHLCALPTISWGRYYYILSCS